MSPSRYLRTSEIAKAVGVHPNTVRLYEELGFLPPVPRTKSNYRQYTEAHLDQMQLARMAFREYCPGRSLITAIVRKAAGGDLGGALEQAYAFLSKIRSERAQAEAAVEFLERWVQGTATDVHLEPLTISNVAKWLGTTTDMLRNWERNGLLTVPRDPKSGYRLYGPAEVGRVRVIRMLRQAGYSLMAILRMLLYLDQGQTQNLRAMLDTPRSDEDVYSVADRWLSTLESCEKRALDIIAQLEKMIAKQKKT